jgi:hypothetical protein
MKWIAAGAAAIVGFVALFAYARPNVDDPNDAGGVLDIRRVDFKGEDRPRFKTITFATWTVDRVHDRGFVLVYFDTRGGERFDFYALARSNGKEMVARLYRDRRQKKDVIVAGLDSWRANKRSVTIRVPLAKLGVAESRTFYRWYVQTLFTGPSCKKVCFDKVPDGNPTTQPLPGATPTPTPVPSPTASPTPEPTATPTPTESPVPQPTIT